MYHTGKRGVRTTILVLMETRISNIQLGKLIGLSHASVSRIRSGDRLPSIRAMARIARLCDWSIDDQVAAREAGNYPEEFEKASQGMSPEVV